MAPGLDIPHLSHYNSRYDRHLGDNWLAVPICHLSRFALFGKEYTVYLPLVLRNR